MPISRLASTGSDNRPSGTQALTGRVDTFVSNLSDLFRPSARMSTMRRDIRRKPTGSRP